MTISTGFLAKSSQVAGVALTGMYSWSSEDGIANQVNTRSDGELYEVRTALIPANSTITVTTRDLASTGVAVGVTGALSLVSDKMTGGVALAGTVTYGATSSTILSVSRSTDLDGATNVTITARVNAPAGGATNGVTVTSV